MSSGLDRTFKDIQKNRQGDGTHGPGTVRGVIWDGLMIDRDLKQIVACPGFIKEKQQVYCVEKSKYTAFRKGRWQPETLEATIQSIKEVFGAAAVYPGYASYEWSGGKIVGIPRTLAQFEAPEEEDNLSTWIPTELPAGASDHWNLWIELAFFTREVRLLQYDGDPYPVRPGMDPNATLVELTIPISGNRISGSASPQFVLHPNIDPITKVMVPKGGGEGVSKKANRRKAVGVSIQPNQKGDGTDGQVARIQRINQNVDSLYLGVCTTADPELPFDGDAWYEGIRSSITRGIYQVWTDDIGAGPMVQRSRTAVKEATARYEKAVAAGELRMATERENRAGAHVASTAIMPTRVWIEDWFGDPNFYVGLMTFVMQIIAGFGDGPENKSDYKEIYYDEGTFDYGKIYNKYEGVEV